MRQFCKFSIFRRVPNILKTDLPKHLFAMPTRFRQTDSTIGHHTHIDYGAFTKGIANILQVIVTQNYEKITFFIFPLDASS
jgi:hypothetical protein